MSKATVIAGREIASYFHSPVAYVATTLFLIASGIAFWGDFVPGEPASMRSVLDSMVWFLVFIVPVLSMGLLAQERATGTFETMMTAPISEFDIVVGKFLGGMGFILVLISPTLLYALIISIYGRLDFGPVLSGYLGMVCVAMLYLSVGLLCSSFTRSQIVAAVATAAALFLITIVPWWASQQTTLGAFWRTVVDQMVFRRYTDFSRGIIDIGHLAFFILFSAAGLFLTVLSVHSQRWR